MSVKGKNQRQLRKQVLRHVDATIDLTLLDYKKRVTPQKHYAKLVGVVTAICVYAFGFGLAYYAVKTGTTNDETFMKFSWIFMLPASVIGLFSYLLSSNRREYAVAKDIREYLLDLEGRGGLLWRYGPVQAELLPDDPLVERTIESSRLGTLAAVEPEDLALVINQLHAALSSGEGTALSEAATEELERQLAEMAAPLAPGGAAEFERNLAEPHSAACVQAPRNDDRHRAVLKFSAIGSTGDICVLSEAEFSRGAGRVPASHDCHAVEAYAWHDDQAVTIPRCCLWSATHGRCETPLQFQPRAGMHVTGGGVGTTGQMDS